MKGREALLPFIESIERGSSTERGFQFEGDALCSYIEAVKREALKKKGLLFLKGRPPFRNRINSGRL